MLTLRLPPAGPLQGAAGLWAHVRPAVVRPAGGLWEREEPGTFHPQHGARLLLLLQVRHAAVSVSSDLSDHMTDLR